VASTHRSIALQLGALKASSKLEDSTAFFTSIDKVGPIRAVIFDARSALDQRCPNVQFAFAIFLFINFFRSLQRFLICALPSKNQMKNGIP